MRPVVLRKIVAAREQTRLAALLPTADAWLVVVRRLRPARPWDEVIEAVNAVLPAHAVQAYCAARAAAQRQDRAV